MAHTSQFKIGEHIVYPLQGVGIIKDIREKTVKDTTKLYYIIYIDISDLTVSIPVDKVKEIGIRALVSSKEARDALLSFSQKFEQASVDWKARYQINLNLVKEGSIQSIVKVVQGLYYRSKIKELPIQERKLYDSALRLLIDECSFSMNKDPEDIEKEIFCYLEK